MIGKTVIFNWEWPTVLTVGSKSRLACPKTDSACASDVRTQTCHGKADENVIKPCLYWIIFHPLDDLVFPPFMAFAVPELGALLPAIGFYPPGRESFFFALFCYSDSTNRVDVSSTTGATGVRKTVGAKLSPSSALHTTGCILAMIESSVWE